jgi:hypothetical protein
VHCALISILLVLYLVKNIGHECFDTIVEKVEIVEIASISAIEEMSAIAAFADKNMMAGNFPMID